MRSRLQIASQKIGPNDLDAIMDVAQIGVGLTLSRVAVTVEPAQPNCTLTCTSLKKTEKTSARLMKICSAFFVELMMLLFRIEFALGMLTVENWLSLVMFARA